MSVQLEEKVQGIKAHVLGMARLVRTSVEKAGRALADSDLALAAKVVEEDAAINAALQEIDKEIMGFQALEQPVAADLRFSIASSRVIMLLEHIGDQSLRIANLVTVMSRSAATLPPCPALTDLIKLTLDFLDEAVLLYTYSTDADFTTFVDNETKACELVTAILRFYIDYMLTQDRLVEKAANMILVSRHFKGIVDYTMNIVENIFFVMKGVPVVHVCYPE